MTWNYQEGVVDCTSLLGWPRRLRATFAPAKAGAEVISWSSAMFTVSASGELTFGDRSETESNVLIGATLDQTQVNVPTELTGRFFPAIALCLLSVPATPPWLLTFIDGRGDRPATVIDLRTGRSQALPGFPRVLISSLFPDRLHVLRRGDGRFVLRVSPNPTDPTTGHPRRRRPAPVDVDLEPAPSTIAN